MTKHSPASPPHRSHEAQATGHAPDLGLLPEWNLANLYPAMDSPAYLRVAHDNSSPWTKRVTARARVQRFAGEQLHPGNVVTGRPARVQVIRFRGLDRAGVEAATAGLRASYEGRAEVNQLRVLVHDNGAAGQDVCGFIEARAPLPDAIDVAAFGQAASRIDLVAQYSPF